MKKLTDLELEIMNVIWEKGEATVKEVQRELSKRRPLAYTTILTVLSRLAQKGVLEFRKVGKAHVFKAKMSKNVVARSRLSDLIDKLFGGSVSSMVAHLLETSDLRKQELLDIKRILDEKLKGGKG